jgi:hypothetical protein
LYKTNAGQMHGAAAKPQAKGEWMKTPQLALAILLLSGATAIGQTVLVQVKPLTDDDIKLMRQDVQAVKDDVIQDTMQFTAAEGKAFWPIYKQYAEGQRAIAEQRFAVIMDYAKNLDTMTNAQANGLSQRMLQVEDNTQALRKKYLPKFEAALGAKRAAKFFQVDNRLTMFVNIQLASAIPLIP